MAQEIAQIESSVIRTGARRIADELGVDFREARVILTEVWREYRTGRAAVKAEEAEAAELTDDDMKVHLATSMSKLGLEFGEERW